MSKRLFLLILVALVFSMTSCQREQDWDAAPDIRAKVESEQKTRTSLSVDESGAGTIYWNPSDKIDVFFGSTKASYTSQNASDAITAVFKTSDSVSGADITSGNIWGLYPSNSSSSCDGNAITTSLPATQYGVPNTFDKDIFPAIAHSSSTSLQFYNVCGGIKFNLAFDDIKKVTFRGNNNEDVAGVVSISFVDGVPKATAVNGVKEITLTPKTGATFTKGADYYITLLPGTFSEGFTMSFTTTDGSVAFFNYSESEVTIRRSIFSRKSNLDVYASFGDERQPNNVIYYTSGDGNIITPYAPDVFGASIVSNEYVGGKGIITFDGEVTSIGHAAFYLCYGLTSLEIPNSVTSIGEWAFSDCSGLTSLEIPNSVTSIGHCAFQVCSGLTSLEIPNSVTSIGSNAFSGCSGLTSLEIPNSVTSIGSSAFNGCSGLTSLEIPNSVTSIGANPFIFCSGLSSITVENGNPAYDSRNGCNAIIKSSTNELISGCVNTIIPNSVTSIGSFAFNGCSGLTSLEIPNSVTSIRDYAFQSCSGLTSLEIPNSVTSIGSSAFNGCSGLPSLEIPNSVTSIGANPFRSCSGLSSITVENGNPAYDSRNDCNAIINTTTNELISGCVNTIIPNSVTSIGSFAFNGCSGLTSLEIPNSVTSIRDYAFQSCSGLTSLEIPNSVTSIGFSAFIGCRGLTSIRVCALTPPALGSDIFSDTNNCPIYVPAQSVDAYKTADGWSEYADRIYAMGASYEAVDLGLPSGVKWATCNVGASSPEEYGDYFAWGETEAKTDYSWSTYKWCNGSETTLTKYNTKSNYGTVDNKTVLDLSDDAARANWGGSWRMPTDAEWTELRTQCVWTLTTLGGKNGYNVRGPNGNTIFLPAAGYRYGAILGNAGSYGSYWSSSLNTDNPSDALGMIFDSSNVYRLNESRYFGQSVRPVSE